METREKTKIDIISAYMDTVLETEQIPKSVYKFSKRLEIEETDFYKHFASFTNLQKHIFKAFFDNAHEVISNNEDYQQFDAKNKLLTFYYTFFEILTANRSYVTFVLQEQKNKLESLEQLKELRLAFMDYIKALEIKKIDLKKEELIKIQNKSMEELAWGQLLITLKFWLEDESPAFEKTDLFIEKSIHAGFDLMDLTPFKNIIDFGKFLFKEKVKR